MADLGIARIGKEADANGTLTRADLADVVHRQLGLSRAESAGLVERVLHHMCHALSGGRERQDFRLRHVHPARQGRARRPQSQDRRRSADRAAARDDLPRQPDHARPDRQVSLAAAGEKAPGAFKTIGELSPSLASPSISCAIGKRAFPSCSPMQRAGNRRYYRPADVALARRIHRLLNQEGYTVRGVQKLLRDKERQPIATACDGRSGAAPRPTCRRRPAAAPARRRRSSSA